MAKAAQQVINQDTPAKLRAVDAWYWAVHEKIMLQAGPFTHFGHEYLAEVLRDTHPNQVWLKGSQLGFTEANVLQNLHGMIYEYYPQGVLYLFPTERDVSDFSKARFNTLIEYNPDRIGRHVLSTDSTNIKRVGKAMLYLRGARATKNIEGLAKSSSALKSIPVDRVNFDELDEMDPAMIPMAEERMAHSSVKHKVKLSTPTVPDYGIDKEYKTSDRHVWAIRCGHCGHDTVMELEFPRCLSRHKDGAAFRCCVRCGREIYPKDGQWIAMSPTIKEKRGRWISQLCSIFVNPTVILNEFDRIGELKPEERQVFYNSKLGQAYVDAANRLAPQDIYRCQGQDAMDTRHNGPCCMGVDVGTFLHVVIGYKPAPGVVKVAHVARLLEWNDLHDLAQRFNVSSAVIDRKPELHKAREFQAGEPYEVFLMDYQENQRGSARYDLDGGMVTMNRTECLDRVHSTVTSVGSFIIPRVNSEIEEFVLEMTSVVKVLVEKPDGGHVYVYKEVGADHYRHACGYMLLASDRVAVAPSSIAPWWLGSSRENAQAIMDDNSKVPVYGYGPPGAFGQAIMD